MARDQVENGAQIIDVNMDEGLLDSEAAMVTFLASEQAAYITGQVFVVDGGMAM